VVHVYRYKGVVQFSRSGRGYRCSTEENGYRSSTGIQEYYSGTGVQG